MLVGGGEAGGPQGDGGYGGEVIQMLIPCPDQVEITVNIGEASSTVGNDDVSKSKRDTKIIVNR